MASEKTPRKKKLNKIEIEKKIDSDFRKRYTHIAPRENAIEFKLPEKSSLNRMLQHSLPTTNVTQEGRFSPDGTFGELQYYYFPKAKYNAINTLFKKFAIPDDMHDDFRAAYLSMFFAHCTAFYTTNHNEEFERNQKELFASLDFLESSFEEKILIRGISFEFQARLEGRDAKGHLNLGKVQSRKFKDYVAVQFLERVLQNYKEAKGYDSMQSMYDHRKKYGKSDMFFGHKNAEKHSQNYFSTVLFSYMKNRLFNSAFELYNDPVAFNAEVKRLKKMYSRRRMFLFIGELMIESELLELDKTTDDESIIENIEKKLTPHLRASKKKVQDIEERNAKSTDGSYEVTMFGDLF